MDYNKPCANVHGALSYLNNYHKIKVVLTTLARGSAKKIRSRSKIAGFRPFSPLSVTFSAIYF